MGICNIDQGTDINYEILVEDADGPVNITSGFTVQFVMKTDIELLDSVDLPEVLGPITATISNVETGKANVELTNTQTAQLSPVKYYYEFRLYDSRLSPTTQYTLDKGTVFVNPQVFS